MALVQCAGEYVQASLNLFLSHFQLHVNDKVSPVALANHVG